MSAFTCLRSLLGGLLFSLALTIIASPPALAAGAADCLPVLAKDTYFDARQHSLVEDYLRTVDESTWRQLAQSQDVGASLFGVLDLTSSYQEFSQTRDHYLSERHYERSEADARQTLRIVTNDRAYAAYSDCLQHIGAEGLEAWADRETMDAIYLSVRFVNPQNLSSVRLAGTLVGGRVNGARAGRLWRDTDARWGVNQTKHFVIQRAAGTATTTVSITSSHGESVTLAFERADATLTLNYSGSAAVFRRHINGANSTPNNDNVRADDGCLRQVGSNDGWCMSSTRAEIRVSSPFFLRDFSARCIQGGCPFTSMGSVNVDEENRHAEVDMANWGPVADFEVSANVFEQIDGSACGAATQYPVIIGRTLVVDIRKECAPITTLRLRRLGNADGGESVVRFGDSNAAAGVSLIGQVVDTGSWLQATYSLTNSQN